MTNPFSGLITSDFTDLWKNAIESLLEVGGCCSTACRFVYEGTKFSSCPNCLYDAVGNKSSNRFQDGGPMPFRNGSMCPMCNGAGKLMESDRTEINYMVVIWSYEGWKQLGLNSIIGNSPNLSQGEALSLSVVSLYPNIMRANYVILDTSLEGAEDTHYQRLGKPDPVSFGGSAKFLLTKWQKT